MDGNGLKDFILYTLLGFIFIYALVKLNVFSSRRGVRHTLKEREKHISQVKKRGFYNAVFKRLESMDTLVGKGLSQAQKFEWQYKIDRCDMKIKVLERRLKATELNGIFRSIQLLSIIMAILAYSFTFQLSSLIWLVGLATPILVQLVIDARIQEEDAELEHDFPDLYLLLYSRLIKGAHASTSLIPTITDYVNSLNEMYGVGKGHLAIRKFCGRFVANSEIYGDLKVAVRHLRNYYHSPTIINFCNLAAQSLDGVHNADKLLGFKQELNEQRKQAMEKYAERLVVKGNRAVFVIYVILGEFVILSWVAKIDLSLFSGLFG